MSERRRSFSNSRRNLIAAGLGATLSLGACSSLSGNEAKGGLNTSLPTPGGVTATQPNQVTGGTTMETAQVATTTNPSAPPNHSQISDLEQYLTTDVLIDNGPNPKHVENTNHIITVDGILTPAETSALCAVKALIHDRLGINDFPDLNNPTGMDLQLIKAHHDIPVKTDADDPNGVLIDTTVYQHCQALINIDARYPNEGKPFLWVEPLVDETGDHTPYAVITNSAR